MQNLVLNSLGCTQNPNLLKNYLTFAVDSENSLSNAERSRILSSSINHGENSIRILIEFTRENSKIIKKFDLLSTVCGNIASRISSRNLLNEFLSVLEFLQSTGDISEAVIGNYKTSANVIIDWQTANLRSIQNFFEDQEKTTTPIKNSTERSSTTTEEISTTLGAKNVVISLTLCIFSSILVKVFN